jgi:F-type H+-transporting ATPase subunit delta
MPSRSIPRKYAEALFHLAEETDGIDAVRGDLESLAEVLRKTPVLKSFIESPDVAEAEKTTFFESTIRGKVKNATWEFLQLLLRRKRTALLPEIFSEYLQIDEERKGIQKVMVVSAVPLDKSEEMLLTSRLHALTGKTILIDTQVDPSILGGVVVYLGGKVIDGSVRTGLEELKGRLLATSMD